MNKLCPLCDKELPIKSFVDNKLYHEHKVCIKCCVKASKRIDALTKFDMQLCEGLSMDYNLLNSYKGLLFDKQFSETERIIEELVNEPLEENVPNDSLISTV